MALSYLAYPLRAHFFDSVDANNDGKVTREEMQAFRRP
ncbi:EF-hand domain-containing protein [Rhizobium sp. CBN3]|nr:EF-hand domain-containing protein [Rhizobium sp. CBN3]MDO3435456.1 EF-hand domain-containing protein [Rhizobium sp. CBN3]